MKRETVSNTDPQEMNSVTIMSFNEKHLEISSEQGMPAASCSFLPRVSRYLLYVAPTNETVASAGYRAIAPDMRGNGHSSAPADATLYTPLHTAGDLVPRPRCDEPIVSKLPPRIIDTEGPVDGAFLRLGCAAPRADA